MEFLKKIFTRKVKSLNQNTKTESPSDEQTIAREFQNKFQIRFENENLIVTALKHRSYLNVTNEERVASNERLEFLGDAVLDLVVTHYLFGKFPKRTEGELSKIKSILVSKPVLAEIAMDLSLGSLLLLNRGEEKTGGRQRQSILADTFEAVIGAIYLDKGLAYSEDFIMNNLLVKFKSIMQRELYKNYKSMLLEYAQSDLGKLPEYRIIRESGPDHDKSFVIGVYLNGDKVGQGAGKSKKTAEQEAAKYALQRLGLDGEKNSKS